jgi:hypothetical protein
MVVPACARQCAACGALRGTAAVRVLQSSDTCLWTGITVALLLLLLLLVVFASEDLRSVLVVDLAAACFYCGWCSCTADTCWCLPVCVLQ